MKDPKQILKRYWGYDDFRGIQREIIDSVMAGHDTLGLMPTGGGKSITFQVPALIKGGVCLVITPLIALMKDQVDNLKARGIKAAAIYSGQPYQEMMRVMENAIFGAVNLLYVSPERLASRLFLTKLRHMPVTMITVDEAHCISQWGHDFRPAYLKIADVKLTVGEDVPILALTATATKKVVEDIQQVLNFRPAIDENTHEQMQQVFCMSFERKNLTYKAIPVMSKRAELLQLLHTTEGCTIIYLRDRQGTQELSSWLNKEGISATFYHAGVDPAEKDKRQKAWQMDEVRVMVATNAFGMGIDKPDVRYVIHMDVPDSLEEYFQEAGRGGRDGKGSDALLFMERSDLTTLRRRVEMAFPPRDEIRNTYDQLGSFFQLAIGDGAGRTYEFDIQRFCKNFRHFPARVNATLQILQRAGYIEYDEIGECSARIHFIIDRDALYNLHHQSDKEMRLTEVMLRTYTGMFSDFVYIDEPALAMSIGCSTHEVYLMLKSMSDRHIIKFIPHKRIPTITYTQRREMPEELIISREVYEVRREQYEQRINSVIDYCCNNSKCRSRQLLAYFGEESKHNCGKCDICDDTVINASGKEVDKTISQIMQTLADKEWHKIYEFRMMRTCAVREALQYLLSEEKIESNGILIRKC